MTNSQTFNEIRQPVEGIPGCVFDGLIASKTESASFEAWIATLTRLADEQEHVARVAHDVGLGNSSRETKPPLEKLAAGPWTSLGGYFDYSLWPDRERFLELDKAIASGQELRDGVEQDIEMV